MLWTASSAKFERATIAVVSPCRMDTAQVALDLARKLMELALGGGESLLGRATDPTVLTPGAGAAEGLGAGIAGARSRVVRLRHWHGADADGIEVGGE